MRTKTMPPPEPTAFVRPCATCGQLVDTNEGEASRVRCQGCEAWVRGLPREGAYTDEVVKPRGGEGA